MNKKIKIFAGIVILVLFGLIVGNLPMVRAADVTPPSDVPKAGFQDFQISQDAPKNIAANIMNWFFVIAAFLCIAVIVWAGVTYATAGGDEEKVTKAKQRLIYGIIGIAVVVAAYAIIYFIQNTLSGGTNIAPPTIVQ